MPSALFTVSSTRGGGSFIPDRLRQSVLASPSSTRSNHRRRRRSASSSRPSSSSSPPSRPSSSRPSYESSSRAAFASIAAVVATIASTPTPRMYPSRSSAKPARREARFDHPRRRDAFEGTAAFVRPIPAVSTSSCSGRVGTIPSASSDGSIHRASAAARSLARRIDAAVDEAAADVSIVDSAVSPAPAPPPLAGPRPAESRSSRYRRRASLAASSARADAPNAAAFITSRSVRRASRALSTPLAIVVVAPGSAIDAHATSPVVSSRGRRAAYVAAYVSRRRCVCVSSARSARANRSEDLAATSSAAALKAATHLAPFLIASSAPALASPAPTPGLVSFRPSRAWAPASSRSQLASDAARLCDSFACPAHADARRAALSASTLARCLVVSRSSTALACAPSSDASCRRLASISCRHSHRTAMSDGENAGGTSRARLSALARDSSCAA
mmetsp:Transcript_528/g.1989  ORF Transcript_528/g.1989 Transcript_528/m.1989 type:complete len:447 (-) Transcript_528:350-1690(-)